MSNDPRRIGFAASSHSELFPSPRLSTCFARPFPRDLLRPRDHPLSHSPLQSAFASSPRSSPFGASFTCLGSRPSSRHHPCAATHPRRLPRHRFVPSSGFHSLSTSSSALGLAGLFHPAATSRVLPVQGLLSPRSHPSSSEGVAPRPLFPPRADRLAPAATRCGPRLRGLHPRETAFTAAQLFTTPHAAPLFGFVSSRSSPHSVDRSLPTISAHDVFLARAFAFTIALRARPQRLSREKPGVASPLRPPARAFEPSSKSPCSRPRLTARCLAMSKSRIHFSPRGCPRGQR